MPESAANFPTASSAPGAFSMWGGPPGKPPVQPKYIPAQTAKKR